MQFATLFLQKQKGLFAFPLLVLPIILGIFFPLHPIATFFSRGLFSAYLAFFLAKRQLWHPAWGFLVGWLCVSVLWSVSPAVSFTATFPIISYILVYILFRHHPFRESTLMWGIRFLVVTAMLLSAYGLYQLLYGYQHYFLSLDQLSESLLPATREVTRDWLTALSGRVFSRFALPSHFASYLLMMLPIHGLLVLREQKILLKIIWGLGFILNGTMFLYTKSFGAWLTCLVVFGGIGSMMILQHYTATWRKLLPAILLFIVVSMGMVYGIGILRGQHLWDIQGNNPLYYRWLNWEAAVRMVHDRFFLGSGLATFGILYPQYMLPGANESQYVHNSYLQIGVEYGFIGLGLTLWFVGTWMISTFGIFNAVHRGQTPPRALPTASQSSSVLVNDMRYVCGLSGLAFLVHNLVDFGLYVYPLGALGVMLLALTMNPQHSPDTFSQHSFGKIAISAGVVGALLLGIVLDWHTTRTKNDGENARMYFQAAHHQEAARTIQQALHAWITLPEHQAIAGSLALSRQQPDTAQHYFQAAIREEPDTPWFHAGLGETYLSIHNLSMAYLEIRRAAELFPGKSAYHQRTREIQEIFASL